MAYQESGDVLMRGRKVDTPPAAPQEVPAQKQSTAAGNGNFTAHNAEFDRRRAELKKQMARDRAAAESELARLSKRCDVLKEFIFEADSAAAELENLNSIINAEKEFAARMEQLEIRYYRFYGRYSDNPLQSSSNSSSSSGETAAFVQHPSGFKSSLPLAGAIVFSALIIAAAMALIFL